MQADQISLASEPQPTQQLPPTAANHLRQDTACATSPKSITSSSPTPYTEKITLAGVYWFYYTYI